MVNSYDVAILSEKVAYLEAALKSAGIELPVVTSVDNGKTLQVVNGAWATGDKIPEDELPIVTAGDNGKALQVIAGAWATGGKIPEIISDTVSGTTANGVITTGKLASQYIYLGTTLNNSWLITPINALSDGMIKLFIETAQHQVIEDTTVNILCYFLKI